MSPIQFAIYPKRGDEDSCLSQVNKQDLTNHDISQIINPIYNKFYITFH